MFFPESYLNLVKNTSNSSEDRDISWDSISIYSRSVTGSDNNDFGKNSSSYDSGHDSYLEEGTGYSGDDEEVLKCDICARPALNDKLVELNTAPGGTVFSKRKRRRRKKRKTLQDVDTKKVKDYGETKFDFEGSASHEKKWTMEYYFDENYLMHRLKRVVIARQGKESDHENMVVLETSSTYAKSSIWRTEVMTKMKNRNEREGMDFDLLPTTFSCESCYMKRKEKVKNSVTSGNGFKQEVNEIVADSGYKESKIDQHTPSSDWRKKILYDLKLSNFQIIRFLNSQRHNGSAISTKSWKKRNGRHGECVEECFLEQDEWEGYEIISDDDVIL